MARSSSMPESISLAEYHALQRPSDEPKSKYNAKAVWLCQRCDGAATSDRCQTCGATNTRRFDSKAEAARYHELRTLERLKEIKHLKCQPKFPLSVNGQCVGVYYGDFQYLDSEGVTVVEDVKGGRATDTPLSRFKRKLVLAIYNIEVQVVTR